MVLKILRVSLQRQVSSLKTTCAIKKKRQEKTKNKGKKKQKQKQPIAEDRICTKRNTGF